MAEAAIVYIIGGIAIGLLAFFFGEPFAIKLLLGVVALIWITDQPDRALAAVQAGLAWSGTLALYKVMDAAIRLHRRLTWRRMVKEIEQVRSEFTRAGMDFDLEMAKAGLRHAQRQWKNRCLGLED